MKLVVKNFGPIAKADVEVKPLTLFVGANASGKSYLLYLLWTLIRVEPDFREISERVGRIFPKILELSEKGSSEEVREQISSFYLWFVENMDRLIEKSLKRLIEDVFMVSSVSELVGGSGDYAEITVISDNDIPIFSAKINKDGSFRVENFPEAIDFFEKFFDYNVEPPVWNTITLEVLGPDKEVVESLLLPLSDVVRFGDQLTLGIPSLVFCAFGYCPLVPDVFISPDGRAGMLRFLAPVSHVLISMREQVLTVSAIDREFFKQLVSMAPEIKDEKIASIADFLENLLEMEFHFARQETPKVLVVDRTHNLKIPLERAPSGAREIAPLVGAMRHVLAPGYMFMVEEPEAHLHPDAQSAVARALALLSRYDVDVVATTHSVHIIDEVNNLVRLSKLSPEEKEKLGYRREEGLNPEDVAVYVVERRSGEVTPLEVSNEGLSETCIDAVLRELANRYVRVEERVRMCQ